MADVFQSLTAFAVFMSIAALGFIFLLASFVFGELFDHLGFDHDMDHGDIGGPSFFSPRILSVFITAFGGTGAVGAFYGLNTLACSGIGFVSGVIFGGLIYLFARFLYGQQASTSVKELDLVGVQARVIIGIPKDGVGQIRCKIGEELVDKIARSENNKAIPENVMVRVEQVLGEMVIVKRV